ncbi:polysaccharide biosynthesis protein [Canibacter sp. lx-72]|uniref:polysaccharide biosynthesis protein n=1 Tax=Canibacter zhuwentaonis TaxID=2837491 RepID=UPI001BDBE5D6|nr:nucleoside-diphosphate sugar epimerase/dehydratase [Canibacter zhuwentaonis]MBT1018316.1 polysaccharide biosynthesis protein [Canibacter zhuwentaonis]
MQDWRKHRLTGERARPITLILVDGVSWLLAIFAGLMLRFDFSIFRIQVLSTVQVALVVLVSQLIFGYLLWLYRSRYKTGSFDEVKTLVAVVTAVLVPSWFAGLYIGYGHGIPRTALIIAAPIAFSIMGFARYIWRIKHERKLKPGKSATRTLIYGAGYAGEQTVNHLLTDAAADSLPVGFIDDDPRARNRTVRGVKVLGTIEQLREIAAETDARSLMVCIGDADAALLRRVSDLASAAGLKVMVMPTLSQILSGASKISDLREISIEDLIGRVPVRLDAGSIKGYLAGKRVLVTGAGGSIGAELCRQLTKFGVGELIMLDRDETALQDVQISIHGNGLLETRDIVLADIRDPQALASVFAQRRPEVVFHAAALKHVSTLEKYPEEAWKTNVLGTLNVLQAAQAHNIETFVNISTDKAANPTSALGHSKRVAEKLTAFTGANSQMRCISVRFGNVLGSRGSMLPTFNKLIAAGLPLTITHPEATRFFMTIPEACQLVMQAGAIGQSGEVLILDMGEPVKIIDIARRMIAQSGKNIELVYTGLRQGEKLHEELIGTGESNERPYHPKISHARVDVLDPVNLDHDEWFERLRAHSVEVV